MNLRLFVRMVGRELRGSRGRLSFFCACVAVGVAAVVGVAALVDATLAGIQLRSRELLGGDLAIESRTPIPGLDAHLSAVLGGTDFRRADVALMATMIRGPSGPSRLAELKAIDLDDGDFPLAGTLELSPARPVRELLDERSVLVARAVMSETGASVGDPLFVGGQEFRIRGVIEREPDPLTFSFAFGPRVLLTRAALERTGLLAANHRIRYRTLIAFARSPSAERLGELAHSLEARIPGGGVYVTVETQADAQPALRNTLERVQRYLGLVALLSLLIASVGVAQIVSTWLAQATPQTAILRCLGLRPREILYLYIGEVAALALLGSLIGSVIGGSLPALVGQAYPELVPADVVRQVPIAALARGWIMGVGVALAFCAWPLTAVWSVSPALVLRAEVAPLPVPRTLRGFALAALTAVIFAAALAQTREPRTAFGFAAGVGLVGALLWLGARALLWVVGRLPRSRLPAVVWQGAAAIARPGAGTTGSLVALGMGSLAVLGITLVQDVLAREISSALPPNAPSVFLLDIQPDQWPEVERMATAAGAVHVQHVPVVMARLRAIDGRDVETLVSERAGAASEQERSRWVLTREQRVTSLRELPDNNRILRGALWQKPDVPEMSLEVEFARDLGAELGSRLLFDVQGVPMEFEVTSLRSVEWRSFSPNFFLVAEPGVLDDAPQFFLGAARVPARAEQSLQDELARQLPNVTVLRVQALLDRAAGLLDQVALAVRLLGAFAAATGLIILAGSIASSQLRRAREAALLKTLGLTRARVLQLFAIEYALGGAVAGATSALGAYALTAQFTRSVLSLASAPSLGLCLLGFVVTVALAVLAGLLASARALAVPPLAVFRQQG